MRKVFSIRSDERFQRVVFDSLDVLPSRRREFSAQPLLPEWPTLRDGYVFDPQLPDSVFRAFLPGAFVIRESLLVDPNLPTIFDMSAELLPVEVSGERCFVVNVLGCYNALIPQKTEWRIPPDPSSRGVIDRATLKLGRLGGAKLFKLPFHDHPIFCLSGEGPEEDFYEIYQQRGYTGLVFEEQMVE